MPFYTKPLSQLDTADLQELLDNQAVENSRLEFKLEVPNKEDTLKKLSSFANTFGGYMLIGAKVDSKDGRLQGLPGVDAVAGYKQKVVDWCFAGASPPLTVEVSDPIPAPAAIGKACYVIYVPESDVAPHFLNDRKGVWIRTDEFSARFEAHLANDSELRHLFDRRKLIRNRRDSLIARARKRFQTYLNKKHADRGGQRTNLDPLFEFCVVPRFPARSLCAQERLTELVTCCWIPWGVGTTFPFQPNSSTLSQRESVLVLDPTRHTSIFEVNVWGMLFYATTIRMEGTTKDSGPGIHTHGFVGLVLLFIRHASKILDQLGYAGPIIIEASLGAICGVNWLYAPGRQSQELPGSLLDDEVTFCIPTTSDALRENSDAVAMEVLRSVFFSVNLAGLVITPQNLEKLVAEAHISNWGQAPQPLRT